MLKASELIFKRNSNRNLFKRKIWFLRLEKVGLMSLYLFHLSS
jgi:hypothetical protein